METVKKPWMSKTMVLNAVMGLVAFVALFWSGAESVKLYIDSHAAEIGMIWSVLNMILRTVTKEKIGLTE